MSRLQALLTLETIVPIAVAPPELLIYFTVYSVGISSSLGLLSSNLFMLLFMYFRLIDHCLKVINLPWRRHENADCFLPGGCYSITNLANFTCLGCSRKTVGSFTEWTVSLLIEGELIFVGNKRYSFHSPNPITSHHV